MEIKNNKQTIKKSKLKLIKHKDMIEGYTISNIKKVLDPKTYAEFEVWIYGQTVGIYRGESLIYWYDFARFLKGFPILD